LFEAQNLNDKSVCLNVQFTSHWHMFTIHTEVLTSPALLYITIINRVDHWPWYLNHSFLPTFFITLLWMDILSSFRGRRDRDRMVVGFITTYAISPCQVLSFYFNGYCLCTLALDTRIAEIMLSRCWTAWLIVFNVFLI
jgi:hypothetical protein